MTSELKIEGKNISEQVISQPLGMYNIHTVKIKQDGSSIDTIKIVDNYEQKPCGEGRLDREDFPFAKPEEFKAI